MCDNNEVDYFDQEEYARLREEERIRQELYKNNVPVQVSMFLETVLMFLLMGTLLGAIYALVTELSKGLP